MTGLPEPEQSFDSRHGVGDIESSSVRGQTFRVSNGLVLLHGQAKGVPMFDDTAKQIRRKVGVDLNFNDELMLWLSGVS
jgi:hypothetical protein